MDFRCESVSFSANANLENYFRKAIIHLTSPQVQLQKKLSSPAKPKERHYITRRTPGEYIALALFTVCSFRRQLQSGAGGARRSESKSRRLLVALALTKKLHLAQVNYRAYFCCEPVMNAPASLHLFCACGCVRPCVCVCVCVGKGKVESGNARFAKYLCMCV